MVCCVVAAAIFGLFVRALHPRRRARHDANRPGAPKPVVPVAHRRVEVADGALVRSNPN
jgi:hypothetical protein